MCFKCVFLSETEVMAYHNPSLERLEECLQRLRRMPPPLPPSMHRRRQMEAVGGC